MGFGVLFITIRVIVRMTETFEVLNGRSPMQIASYILIILINFQVNKWLNNKKQNTRFFLLNYLQFCFKS